MAGGHAFQTAWRKRLHCGRLLGKFPDHIVKPDTLGETFTSFGLLLCFIQTCGHRWKNIFYIRTESKLPTGVCYGMPSDLRTELSKRIAPCYQGKAWF